MTVRFALAGLASLGLTACSTLETLPVVSDLPHIPVPDVLRIETTADTPVTLIERALSGCDKRTEAGEAACVKAALVADNTPVPALAGMMPGCRSGQICHASYTTVDLVGFYRAAASRFVVHWRVDVDLTRPAATMDAVSIAVVQV